jgi:hypothetical protein
MADQQTDEDVGKLNGSRNTFIHFVVDSLSLNVSEMPRIVGNRCKVIEHLAIRHPTFLRHLDDAKQERIAKALSMIGLAMDDWSARHGVGVRPRAM